MERIKRLNISSIFQTITASILLFSAVNCQADYPGNHDFPFTKAIIDAPLLLTGESELYTVRKPDHRWQIGVGDADLEASSDARNKENDPISFHDKDVGGWSMFAEYQVYDWLAVRGGTLRFDPTEDSVCNPTDSTECVEWTQQVNTYYLMPVVDLYRYREWFAFRWGMSVSQVNYDAEYNSTNTVSGPGMMFSLDIRAIPYVTLELSGYSFSAEDLSGDELDLYAGVASIALRF